MRLDHQESSVQFQARVWVDEESVLQVECWVQEFEPVVPGRRSGHDWVLEHLDSLQRDGFAEHCGLQPGCWQILMHGELRGWQLPDTPDGPGEWDEELTVAEVAAEAVPADYIELIWGEHNAL